jgi:RNA polymerase sigma factor (sigma-70 family)
MGQNYGVLFEGWEIAVAKKLISTFRAKWPCLEREDFDDLLQEVLIHWLSARDSYKPGGKASRKTYMAKVVERKLLDLVDERNTDKRRAGYVAESLDAPIGQAGDKGDKDLTLMDVIVESECDQTLMDAILLIPLRTRLAKAWGDLTPRQRDLCELRKQGHDMTEAIATLGISKDEAYAERKRIQAIFEKAGLKDYLD